MWRNLKFLHIWHVRDVENIHNVCCFVVQSVLSQFTHFFEKSVLSQFTHFCMENCLCEKNYKYQVCCKDLNILLFKQIKSSVQFKQCMCFTLSLCFFHQRTFHDLVRMLKTITCSGHTSSWEMRNSLVQTRDGRSAVSINATLLDFQLTTGGR